MENRGRYARKLASQMWGEVQHQKKIVDGIWWFDTASHGGYIVDTEVYRQFAHMNQLVLRTKNSHYGLIDEQGFAPFEEDCDAMLIEYMFSSAIAPDYYQNYKRNVREKLEDIMGYEEFLKEFREKRLNCLKHWRPEWVSRYNL